MALSVLIFAGSLALLIFSSNKFIDSSERIGLSLGISPFIIGVTIVAFGTSLPELATSIISVYRGSSEIVVGNVIGSNITNILLVVGISAMAVRSLKINRNLMEVDMSLLIGSSVLLWFALKDLHFSLIEALIFASGLIGFLIYSIQDDSDDKPEKVKTNWTTYLIALIAGVGVYFGAAYTVESITDISTTLGISPAVVSLSALALGTSLPEIVVSVAASRRGMHEMAIGNVIGSNLFNTYGVMAIPSFFGELVIPAEIMNFSMPFMVIVTGLFCLVCYSRKVSFWEAGMLLSFYVFFLAELIRLGFVN